VRIEYPSHLCTKADIVNLCVEWGSAAKREPDVNYFTHVMNFLFLNPLFLSHGRGRKKKTGSSVPIRGIEAIR
jgi:hypothetical protein